MRKFLIITEYSNKIPYKIPIKEDKEFEIKRKNYIIRSSIKESIDLAQDKIRNYMFNDSKVEEKAIPLDKVIIYDDIDNLNKDQKIAYVYECPICLNTIITSESSIDFCPQCENDKFLPQLIALINTLQVEDLAINYDKDTSLILVKDNKVVFEDISNNNEV